MSYYDDRTYQEKLKDPRWQRKRLEVFNRDNFTCVSCNNTERTLHVHHLKYIPGRDPWDYEMYMLVTYCEVCHETEHLIGDDIRDIFFELLQLNRIYIHPLAQVNTLIEQYPPFYHQLKQFLNVCMMEYLRTKEQKAA